MSMEYINIKILIQDIRNKLDKADDNKSSKTEVMVALLDIKRTLNEHFSNKAK